MRISIWQIVFGENGIHFCIVLTFRTENVYYFSHRVLAGFGPLGDFYHSLVAVFTAFETILGNKDVVGINPACRFKKSVIFLNMQFPHESFTPALQNSNDLRFAGMLLATRKYGCTHTISVHSTHTVAFRNKN